jgi:soluble lytic murein transglycosylase-like protein
MVTVPAETVLAIEPEDVFSTLAAPESTEPFGDLIRAAAEETGIEEHLISSVIAVESNFNPRAVSRKNAQGLMQLMPATAAQFAARDVFDPQQNIAAGTRYLKELLDRYSNDLRLALAAYNAGPDRVARYGGVPPFAETRAYVERVLKQLEERRKRKS